MLKKFTTILLSIFMLLALAIGLTACEDISRDTYYTVTFELNGGSIEDKDLSEGISVKENTVINFSEYIPMKTDCSFDGWLIGETLYTSTDTFTVTENVTFSAKWTDLVAQALATAKTTAKASLETYVNAENYRLAQQEELATAIANGKIAIDNATDIAGVESSLANAKTVIDEIKTDAELTAEETAQALATAKTTAKASLETYVNAENYRLAQQEELATAIANGKIAIDNATDIAGVESSLANAKAIIDEIKTDAELTAKEVEKEPTIETAFTNGQVFTNTRATLDVVGRKANGDKLPASKVNVMVNGEKASVNWDDEIKASYNFVFVEGENTIVITAVDGNYTKTVTYVVSCDLDKAATITVSIEAFTVGLGYLVEPFSFELTETNLSAMAEYYGKNSVEEFKQVLSMAHVLDYVLYINEYTMSYQGSLESTWNGFYMSSISGIADTSTIVVPEELYIALEENGYFIDEYVYEDGTLCEFDVTWGSGWMYFVNNEFPNIPFCDYVPQDGDVMRVQFTLAYGADIGDWGMMGDPMFEVVDRDELTKAIAMALKLDIDVSEAIEVISAFGVTQEEIDAAYQTLETSIKAKNNE